MPKAQKRARFVGFLLKNSVSSGFAPGIAALDIVDAEPIEHRGDVALVVEREIDARRQRAVAQRGVEKIEAFAGHRLGSWSVSGRRRRRSRAFSSWWCWRAIGRRRERDCAARRRSPAARTAAWRRRSLRSSGVSRRARSASCVSASISAPPAPWRANSGVDKEHIDGVCALEAGEAGGRALDDGDQGQGAGEPRAESVLVVGRRGPGLALIVVVVLRRQLLDRWREKSRRSAARRRARRGAGRRRSSLELPGRRAVLAVLHGDAERSELVAQPVGRRPVPRRRALRRARRRCASIFWRSMSRQRSAARGARLAAERLPVRGRGSRRSLLRSSGAGVCPLR